LSVARCQSPSALELWRVSVEIRQTTEIKAEKWLNSAAM
jgi:hypothetical protein